MWPQIASYFGVELAGPPEPIQPLATKFADASSIWQSIADKHALAERDVDKLVSWWHTDSDLGRQLECVNDMTKSRLLGFDVYQESRASFFELFDRLRREKIIPA
jgi:hypothetical protein